MSAAALHLRDDVEILQGSATLEEWTEAVALVMSRCVVEDDEGIPLLVLGLDLLQDGDDPSVKAEVIYETVGGGPLGLGDEGQRRAVAVALTASRDLQAGDELTGRYFPLPHAGRYLERYGFVPRRLRGSLAEASVELSFAPADEEDFNFGNKESLLENVGLSTDPMLFLFSTEESFGPPDESEGDWIGKSTLDKMVHILRLRHVAGADSFLLDSVYVDDLWYNCNFRISKDNESAVSKTVIDECDRWLDRFQETEPPPDLPEIGAAGVDVRRSESELLQRLREVFAQELRDTMVDESRRYWPDRQLDVVFPQRVGRGGATGMKFIDDP